jgi:hypothetical protein
MSARICPDEATIGGCRQADPPGAGGQAVTTCVSVEVEDLLAVCRVRREVRDRGISLASPVLTLIALPKKPMLL